MPASARALAVVSRRLALGRTRLGRAKTAAIILCGALVALGGTSLPAIAGGKPVSGAAAAHPCKVPIGAGHIGVCTPASAKKRPPGLRSASARYYGADVSNWQGCVNPSPHDVSFIYIKIDEGLGYHDPYGACTEAHARRNGVDAGLYFFERDQYSARASADKFVADSRAIGALGSLPGALDFETNDAGLSGMGQCNWIRAFGDEYRRKSGLSLDVVYSAPGLWPHCTHVPSAAAWVATYGPSHGFLSGFPHMQIWQYSDQGPYGGDGDVFVNGSPHSLLFAAHHPTLTVRATIDNVRLAATFRFTATGKVYGFQCALTPQTQGAAAAPSYATCRSPSRYSRLKPGSYTFVVRSLGPHGGTKALARRTFTVGSA